MLSQSILQRLITALLNCGCVQKMSFYRQALKLLSRKKLLLLLTAVVLSIYLSYERRYNSRPLVKDNNGFIDIYRGLRSPHSITERLLSTHAGEADTESSIYRRQKIFLAFCYWEQLTMATNNFLNLTALAAQGGRQVVVPFVKDSHFRGVPTSHRGTQTHNTLALYYNVSALNETLHLHGYGTLITWEGFQDVCKGKVDVLVCFYYTKLTSSTTNLSMSCAPCKLNNKNVLLGIKIGRRICVNANSLDSVQIFESEVVKNLPCVGIREWRGITTTVTAKRTHFDIESKLDKVLTSQDMSTFFSAKLLRVARDFIAQKLTSNFIAVHIRTEKILSAGGNISAVKRCLFNLRKRLQNTIQVAIVPPPIFLATDFTAFGSSSKKAIRARKYAKSFIEILLPLRPIVFRPSEYKIVDGGAVAIVEMNILASGRRLFVLGGGSFQLWITNQFLTKNKNDHSKVERLVC